MHFVEEVQVVDGLNEADDDGGADLEGLLRGRQATIVTLGGSQVTLWGRRVGANSKVRQTK